MAAAAAARRGIKKAGVQLWQTGVMSLFRFASRKRGETLEETWQVLKLKLVLKEPTAKRRHWQLIEDILFSRHRITVAEAYDLMEHFPDRTPLIDAITELLRE